MPTEKPDSLRRVAGNTSSPKEADRELAGFSLRDTLRAITVRDANFAEFRAALKRAGVDRKHGAL